METLFGVFELFSLVFWHSLTVSFIGWGGLAFALFQPVSKVARMSRIARVVAAVTVLGTCLIALGAWSVGGQTNPHPSYLHGMACVYGYAASLSLTWVIGQLLHQGVERLPWPGMKRV